MYTTAYAAYATSAWVPDPQPIHGYLSWINGYIPIMGMGKGDAEPEGERAVHGHDCLHTKTNTNTLSAFTFAFVGEREGVG